MCFPRPAGGAPRRPGAPDAAWASLLVCVRLAAFFLHRGAPFPAGAAAELAFSAAKGGVRGARVSGTPFRQNAA